MAETASGDQASVRTMSSVALALLVAALVFGYWNSLMSTANFWENPKYSHGYLVPLFTLVLLWLRKDFKAGPLSQVSIIGAGIAGVGLVLGLIALGLGQSEGFEALAISLPFGIQLDLIGTLWLLAIEFGVVGILLFIDQPMDFTQVPTSARVGGLALLLAGLGIRLLSTYFPNLTPEMASFVPSVAGVFLMIGGWKTLRWSGPAIAFLLFMFPLPSFLDRGLLAPLQRIATIASTYCLQTIGLPTFNQGNTIFIGELQLGVVDACSGLRMLTIFIALAVAITLVTDRPIWERLVIVLSAIPIALVVNIIRITVTGICHVTLGPELANKIFHELAGWVMMPMALGLMYIEFQVLSHLMIDDGPAGPLPIGIGGTRSPERRGPPMPA